MSADSSRGNHWFKEAHMKKLISFVARTICRIDSWLARQLAERNADDFEAAWWRALK
jgi:hypothetical protein